MSTKTYDPAKQLFSFGGNIMTGFVEDSFIKVTRTEDGYTVQKGAGGESTRSRNNNKGGEVEIVIMHDSPTNDILSAIYVADELFGTGVVPLFGNELNGTTAYAAANAWIKKMPDLERGKESGGNTWVFTCADLEMFVGGLT